MWRLFVHVTQLRYLLKTEELLYKYALFLIESRARAIVGSVCAVIPRSNNMTPGPLRRNPKNVILVRLNEEYVMVSRSS